MSAFAPISQFCAREKKSTAGVRLALLAALSISSCALAAMLEAAVARFVSASIAACCFAIRAEVLGSEAFITIDVLGL